VALLCHHCDKDRPVVIKTLEAAGIDRDVAIIFREAQIPDRLEHPGIVRLLPVLRGNAGEFDALALSLCLGPGDQDAVVCKRVIQQVYVRTEAADRPVDHQRRAAQCG
jgi:hypothetical protein